MLTKGQQAAYDRDGYLVARSVIPTNACERMCDRLWKALSEKHGLRRDEPESWTLATPRGLQKLCKTDAFAEIASPGFMIEGGEIDGVRLRVVEFTGDAGDVVFFHPWLFHNASPNCRKTPRMMVGQNLPTRAGLSIYKREDAAVAMAAEPPEGASD